MGRQEGLAQIGFFYRDDVRISYLIHGYPPKEIAGTEQHSKQVVEGMRSRGHSVQVIAATRAPGRKHAERISMDEGLIRIVNNFPARPLHAAEFDGAIANAVQTVLNVHKPELIHIQHLQFLSTGIRFSAPTVFTFHDAWTWCAAGGAELMPNGEVCTGPEAEKCANCAAKWRPVPGKRTQGLLKTAGLLAPIIPPERLHSAWQKLPIRLRAKLARNDKGGAHESAEDAAKRNEIMARLVRDCTARISPSEHLARRAEALGLGPIDIIPHGTNKRMKHKGGSGFVFIGTIAHHKGPDLVSEAHEMAFGGNGPQLSFYGPIADATIQLKQKLKGPLSRSAVWSTLRAADALIIGSRWPENYPMIIIEARAVGCPVIAPRIGGIPEQIEDGVDGLLYAPNDAEDLAKAMKRFTENARFNVRPPMDFSTQLDRIEDLYRRIT